MKIEVLLAIMNLKDEIEYRNLLKQDNITGKVVAINQVKEKGFNIENGDTRIFSYKEVGASNSRNKLVEKAEGDICIFADNDTVFVDNYEEIIKKEYEKNPEADIIIFFAENQNSNREKNKRIGNKKINNLNLMKIRTYEITMKKQTLDKIRNENLKFDTNFGPGGIFKKGEETIFISELLKMGMKIYSIDKKISTSRNEESTWFTGFNEKFLFDQGAIFYRIYHKWYKILIIQYLVRKYFLYKKNVSIKKAYKEMCAGAKKCKEMYG